MEAVNTQKLAFASQSFTQKNTEAYVWVEAESKIMDSYDAVLFSVQSAPGAGSYKVSFATFAQTVTDILISEKA